MTNFETALKAEAKKVTRHFQRYSTDQISLMASRPGRACRKEQDRGEFFFTHPSVPGVAFPKRSLAAKAAMQAI